MIQYYTVFHSCGMLKLHVILWVVLLKPKKSYLFCLKLYHEENVKYEQLITKAAIIKGNAIVIDLRDCEPIPAGNRFLEYVLYPEQNISLRIVDGKKKEFAMISVGRSIINRTSTIDVGVLVLKYGGGGHKRVGTCQVSYENVDQVVDEILNVINAH